jgi:predicted transcriptional regulator
VLAASDRLSDDDVADLARKLDRMDRVAAARPWTLEVLRAIDERPGTRAADLAEGFGRDPVPFKRDVRKLKELGLTESLEIGYRLSPRGEAVLRRLIRAK